MRWQDWISATLGVVLFSAPLIFGDTSDAPAMVNRPPFHAGAGSLTAWAGGAVLIFFGAGSLIARWENSIELLPLVGSLLLFLSPWVFGFTHVIDIAWSIWIVAAVACIVTGAALRHGDAVPAPALASTRRPAR
jgi:hypothetical protein